MSRPAAPHPREGLQRRAGVLAVSALLLAGAPALGQQAASPYPPAELFRSLQLTALACSRDNTASSCDKARAMADPLLDHPRLSASCKDTLWTIRQKSVVAPANTIERRDGIDRPAKDVTAFCRQPIRPSTGTATTPPGGTGQAGTGGSLFSPPPGR
ncbi:MAG: hypothetical protein ACKO0M_06645 [Cyanobium sp.]